MVAEVFVRPFGSSDRNCTRYGCQLSTQYESSRHLIVEVTTKCENRISVLGEEPSEELQ